MAASAPARPSFFSAPSWVSTWVRQGVETFVAAQKILLDLTAQQNALAIGVIRERMKMPEIHPGDALAGMASQGITGLTGAGKILLDFAAGETELLVDGIKELLRLGPMAGTVAEVVRHRAETLIEMHMKLLDAVAKQTQAMMESYQDGRGLMARSNGAELAREAMEAFVQTEKKYLNLVSEAVTAATDGEKAPRRAAKDRTKLLTQLAHESVEKYIETQKKLLDLAVEQIGANAQIAKEQAAAIRAAAEEEPRTSFAEVTQKGVKNLISAEKSLLDLAAKPMKKAEAAMAGTAQAPRRGRRRAAKRATA